MGYGQTTCAHVPTTARAVYRSCPMQTECLDYALADESLPGVWGDATERGAAGVSR